MWNKKVGAQIMLYGSYVAGVFVVLSALMMLFGGSMLAAMMPIPAVASKGFFLGLIMALVDLAIGGFLVWVMYSAGKSYLEIKVFDDWKAWVVLILSVLGAFNNLIHLSFGNFIGLLINVLFIFAAAAMLFAPEETE